MHQRARTDPSGGRGATRVPTGTHENADLVVRTAVAVALLQLVEEMLKMGCEPRLGPKALPQSLTHAIADRSAGAPIDLFAVIGGEAGHDGFHWSRCNDTLPSH